MIVITWTLVSVAGLAVVLWLLREAALDKDALEKAGAANGRQVVVRGLVRNQIARTLVLGGFTLVGAAALLRPALPDWTDAITSGIRLGLVACVVLMVWDAWMDYRMARALKGERQERGQTP